LLPTSRAIVAISLIPEKEGPSLICQSCGLEAPTLAVEFQYNIGLLILRVHKSVKGTMRKTCIRKHFWECSLINLLAGWWGVISFVLTPFLIVANIIQYTATRSLAAVPWDARAPELDERALRWLKPHEPDIRARLRNGERMEQLAPAISALAGVSPGQVQLYAVVLTCSSAPSSGSPSTPSARK
jgi:hypothetical protein